MKARTTAQLLVRTEVISNHMEQHMQMSKLHGVVSKSTHCAPADYDTQIVDGWQFMYRAKRAISTTASIRLRLLELKYCTQQNAAA